MHFYMRWRAGDPPRLSLEGVDEVLAEVCSDGFVCRELCLDTEGQVVRASPTRRARSVLLGNRPLPKESLTQHIDSARFEALWKTATDDTEA
jgi:hypothetical protein